jgi:hypothetical protein
MTFTAPATTVHGSAASPPVGPLSPGSRVTLGVADTGPVAAHVASSDGKTFVLELLDAPGEGALEAGAVVEMFIQLAMGVYKWLGLVSCSPADKKVEVQLLDSPRFVMQRLEPRVVAELPAEVRSLLPDSKGLPHHAVVTDLSSGGLKLEGAQHLRADETIEVTVQLFAAPSGSEGTISIMGRVVTAYPSTHSNEPGSTDAHVSFIDGQQEAMEVIDRFIAEQLKGRAATI